MNHYKKFIADNYQDSLAWILSNIQAFRWLIKTKKFYILFPLKFSSFLNQHTVNLFATCYIYKKFPYLDLYCRFEQCLKWRTLFGMSCYLELHKSEAQRAQTLMTGGKTTDFSFYGEQWAFYCELYGILWIAHNLI